MMKSLYEIPPGCICLGDGMLGMRCPAPKHAAANAVSCDLMADNERLRAVLEAQLSELMETYPCFGMGGGSRSEELAQAQWEKEHGRQKAFLRTALAQPAPDAVSAYRASIRREALLEAANLIRQTTPDSKPTDLEWSIGRHGGRMVSIEQIEELAEREAKAWSL